jgi:FKBP-type peptidyl-prolyl cis-trans isomerase (trigger factor)
VDTYLSQIGMSEDDYNTQLETSAEDNAKMLLVIEAVAAKENLTCTEEERSEAIQETLDSAGITEDDYRSQYESYYGDVFAFDEFIRQSVLYDKVVSLLEENAVIKE